MRKVAFYTLGCKLNYSETSTIARLFEQRGYRRVDFTDTPDIFVINTCSVTDNADKKCRKVVKEALSISPGAYVAIVGCYAQLKPQEITQIPGVDAVLGAAEKFQLVDLLDGFRKESKPAVFHSPVAEAKHYYCAYSQHDRTRTFLKVQDGCNYSCSFCTIPLARGESRSDRIANIVATAREIARNDVKEVVLTGVNIGDFGLHEGIRKENFIGLIRALDEVEGIERFRISSIEPNLLTDEIISFVAASRKFVPHFHVPLQSGSNKVLRLMRRRYQRELYASRVARIKELMPHCVHRRGRDRGVPGRNGRGFPGYLPVPERPRHFVPARVHLLGTRQYARPEPAGSGAGRQAGRTVPHAARPFRQKAAPFLRSTSRPDGTVLFEDDVENGLMHGFTENYVRVAAKYDPVLIND
jgi:threonylcarbamoyladenosine tRNA methylthiotransferase MtaB